MKSLAFFSPLSPLRSGVAHYGEALAGELSRYYEIVFYIDDGYSPIAADAIGEARNFREYRGREDITLFQASNGPLHSYMYPLLLEGGAVMTLHDRTLHDMAVKYWEGKSRWGFWRDFIGAEGAAGVLRALAPLPGGDGGLSERIKRNLYLDEENKRIRFKFFRRVVKRSAGIVAHSRIVADSARDFGAKCPVMVTPLGVESAPEPEDPHVARKVLGLEKFGVGENTFIALAFGFIQRHKRILPLLEAWKRFAEVEGDCRLILLGPRSPDLDIDGEIAARGLTDAVIVDDSFPAMDKVNRRLFAADLCVNLRWPVYGSSSYSLMQIMAAGRPCVVTDAETFAELDDDTVIKIPRGDGEVDAIFQAMLRTMQNPQEAEIIGKNAREYIESQCRWPLVAERYRQFLEKIYG